MLEYSVELSTTQNSQEQIQNVDRNIKRPNNYCTNTKTIYNMARDTNVFDVKVAHLHQFTNNTKLHPGCNT